MWPGSQPSHRLYQLVPARLEFGGGVSFMFKATVQRKVDGKEEGFLKTGHISLGNMASQRVRDHCSARVVLCAFSSMLTLLASQKI